jgi:hypothetical protein
MQSVGLVDDHISVCFRYQSSGAEIEMPPRS